MNERPERKKSILLVDDHPIVFLGLKTLLEDSSEFQLSHVVTNNNEAITTALQESPDCIIVDIVLPGRSGLEIIPILKRDCPKCLVIVYSSMPEQMYGVRSLQAGAQAYVNKEAGLEKLLDAIKSVMAGDIYASPEVTQSILKNYSTKDIPKHSLASLSNQELNVLRLIGSGLRLSEIAEKLNISTKTVGTHRERIKNKLNLSSGKELDAFGVRIFQAPQ